MSESVPYSAPQLLASAMGYRVRTGTERCLYCGGSCEPHHNRNELLGDTFTARTSLAVPHSQHVCDGCHVCLREAGPFTRRDGSVQAAHSFLSPGGTLREGRAAQPRMYSWIVTSDSAVAGTKADRTLFRSACLTPPEPPYTICLSESGQLHLLYLARVNRSRAEVTVQLETERVYYQPAALLARLQLTEQVCAVTGKPALVAGVNTRQLCDIHDLFGATVATEWDRVATQPLTRLAIWLAGNREECHARYAV